VEGLGVRSPGRLSLAIAGSGVVTITIWPVAVQRDRSTLMKPS
jgi:hypothetical protein